MGGTEIRGKHQLAEPVTVWPEDAPRGRVRSGCHEVTHPEMFEIIQIGGSGTTRPIMGVADKTNGVAMQNSYIGNTGMENSLGL